MIVIGTVVAVAATAWRTWNLPCFRCVLTRVPIPNWIVALRSTSIAVAFAVVRTRILHALLGRWVVASGGSRLSVVVTRVADVVIAAGWTWNSPFDRPVVTLAALLVGAIALALVVVGAISSKVRVWIALRGRWVICVARIRLAAIVRVIVADRWVRKSSFRHAVVRL